jgi:ADP-ribosylation factor GTPase-activating protein 2/3
LLKQAQQACTEHGTTLHISEVHYHHEETLVKEKDFFADCENESMSFGVEANAVESNLTASRKESVTKNQSENSNDFAEPSVDFLNSTLPEVQKSSIGVRKIQPKKSSLGAKKGLGATKVKTNFADIEERASLANQLKEPVIEKKLTEEEEEEVIASVRLAYQDLSVMKQKEEERLKRNMDPNKAKQVERLGMGINSARRGDVSHSILSDMKTINQDQSASVVKQKTYERESSDSNFEDYSAFTSSSSSSKTSKQDFRDAMMMGFEPINDSKQNVYSMFSPKEESRRNTATDKQPTSSNYSSSSKNTRNSSKPSTADFDTDYIQKKFAGAKGISSDQFFGDQSQTPSSGSSQISKFQNSTSISSSDYFYGDGQEATKSNEKLA